MSPVCTVWGIDETVCPCDLPDGTDPELLAHWQEVSSEILWRASGMRWGTCEVGPVRPCLRSCGGGSGFPWTPYKGADGEWRNIGCGCHEACSCTELCEVVLPGPAASIVEVLIDGVVVDEDSYRLDLVGTQWRLLRNDGSCWPSCSDVNAACDEDGAFCVTYMQGIELDALAIAANTQLSCELTKSCIPGCACLLPKNVSAVTRRGVAITFDDNSKGWLMALPMVAAFLNAVNPNQLTSESSVWSPDVPSSRVTPVPTVS